MAPYVEMEWGTTAYELMWQLKELFDPDYVLNPGVILNSVRCSPSERRYMPSNHCARASAVAVRLKFLMSTAT